MSGESPREALHEWDAAYVLGALSPDDRRAFEAHLEQCAECRASVAELAGLPALLSRVPAPELNPDARAEPGSLTGPPTGLLPSLARRVRRRRVTRRWVAGGIAVLAAAAVALAVVVPMRLDPPPAPTTALTLTQAAPGPLTATVDLTTQRWGTALTMTCHYDSGAAPTGYATTSGRYALYVTDASGTATRVASWSAWPGATIHASGAVDLAVSQLRTVQVRDVSSGTVLLSSPVR